MLNKMLYYLNYFNTNPKFMHSIIGKLHLYFERTTKLFASINLLGSLYKSSKWVSFQTQNIKLPWLKDWIYSTITFLITLLIIFNFPIFAGMKALVYKYTWNLTHHLLPNIYYMLGIFICGLVTVYDNLTFSKQVKVKKVPFTFLKKKKIFTDNYFFYKNMLTLKSTPEQNKNIDLLKSKIKRKLRIKIFLSTYYKPKNNNYFFESNYILTQKHIQEKTLNLNLENLNKLKNFNTDLVIKDNMVFQNNNIAKQQRWLTNNFISSNKIIHNTNKHILLKNFIENPLFQNNLLNTNIWSSSKLSSITNEVINLNNGNGLNKLISLNNVFSDSQLYTNQRYNVLNNLQSNLFLSKVKNQLSFDNISTKDNIKDFNFLYTSLFYKNFNQNMTIYYPSLFFNKKTLYKSSNNSSLSLFYNLNTVDFLQKQDLNLIINLNTTSVQKKNFFFNKNYNCINYKN